MNNVIQLDAHRAKKDTSRGRRPLVDTHLNEDKEDFSGRMHRIRTSLEKINDLMADLKK